MPHSKKLKKQTALKGGLSAFFVSIMIHIVLLFMAGAYVALEIIERQEIKFVAKQFSRPKMKLRKLQVPVQIERKLRRQAPKLSKRVVIEPRLKTKSVEFEMPDITGFGGGRISHLAGEGLGGGSLGFASSQINLFGLRSRGEKIVFLLDTNRRMLVDEVGGIPAYVIIKKELTYLIGKLPPTALFNVVVFDNGAAYSFSENLCMADEEHVERLCHWLAPLNADKRRIGFSTLPSPKYRLEFEPLGPIYNRQIGWLAGMSYALQKQADSVYWLGAMDTLQNMDEHLWRACEKGDPLEVASGRIPRERGDVEFSSSEMERWQKLVAKARRLHSEENARRLERGKPVRVLENPSDRGVVHTYFPSAQPPRGRGGRSQQIDRHEYTPYEVVDYIKSLGGKYVLQKRTAAQIGLKRSKFTFNVVHFVPVNRQPKDLAYLKTVPNRLRGGYRRIQGLNAIQSASRAEE